MNLGTWVYQDLWYSRGVAVKAISPTGFTPNFNGVHIPAGGGAMVVGGICGLTGRGIAIQASGGSCPISGTIELSFASPTYVATAQLSGLCDEIKLHLGSGVVQVVDVSDLDPENGGVWIYKNNVVKMTVGCSGPGLVEAISYVFCPIDGCPIFHLDFSDLVEGQYISDEWKDSKGVIIEARRDFSDDDEDDDDDESGFTPSRVSGYQINVPTGGGARAFNTANPIEDRDLGSPNIDFGGPGRGCGGGKYYQRPRRGGESCQSFAGTNGIPPCNQCILTKGDSNDRATSPSQIELNPYVNKDNLGNVIVIQESEKANPDDSAEGGYIDFHFNPPASVEKLRVLDVNDGTTPVVTIERASGPITRFSLAATGDNGYIQREVFATNVIRLSIYYSGTGCVSELHYGICPSSPSEAAQNWKAGDDPLH
jgi:hypothetical protein